MKCETPGCHKEKATVNPQCRFCAYCALERTRAKARESHKLARDRKRDEREKNTGGSKLVMASSKSLDARVDVVVKLDDLRWQGRHSEAQDLAHEWNMRYRPESQKPARFPLTYGDGKK